MAFSAITSRGLTADKTAGTTIDHSPSAEIAIGRAVVAVVTGNNTALADGASTEHSSVTDTDGHTWTKIAEHTNTAAGAEADGITLSIWRTVTTAAIGVSDVIQGAFASIAASAIAVLEATITASEIAHETPAFVLLDGASDTDVTLSGLTNREYWMIGITAIESDEPPTASADVDYTFIVGGGTAGGAAASNAGLGISSRIVTGTGDTYTAESGVGGGAVQRVLALIPIYEVTGGAGSASPAAIVRSFTIPAATVKGGAVKAAGVISRSFAVNAPTVKGAAKTTPSTISRAFTVNAATVKGGAKTAPSVIPLAVVIPQATASGGGPGLVTPDAIARAFGVNAVTVKGAAAAEPAAIARSFTLGAPTVSGGAKTTPAVIATIATPQTVTVKGAAKSSPAAIARAFTIPQASAIGGGAAVVTPDAIVVVSTLPSVSVKSGVVLSPSTISVPVTVPAPTVKGAAVAEPAAIVVAFVIGQVTVLTAVPPLYVEAGMAVVSLESALGVALREVSTSVGRLE